MEYGNCAIKLDSVENKLEIERKIKKSVIDSWLTKHHDVKIETIKMGDGDYCHGVCFPG